MTTQAQSVAINGSYINSSGVLLPAGGGTGLSSLTSGYIPYGNGTSAFNSSSSLVFDGNNLGVGTAPSAWNTSSYKVIQTPTGNIRSEPGNNTFAFTLNQYIDSSYQARYVNNGYASMYQLSNTGQHQWFTAPSGTAGNALTFTQAMTLDNSGNVGIGTASPAQKLHVSGTGYTSVRIDGANSGGGAYANFYTQSGTQLGSVGCESNGDMYVGTRVNNPVQFIINGSPTAKLDTSGNFQFNSGYGSVANAYGCRAWVNFNGTTSPGTIRGSGNVSSVAKNGTGDYTINFTTAMPDTNYAITGSSGDGTNANQMFILGINVTYSTGSCRVRTGSSGGYNDNPYVNVLIHR
jgi:hypothetical protein